jgi:hypothetical protein
MADPPFYRPLPEQLCQGDVFERVPLVAVKDLPPVIKKTTLAGKREGFEVVEALLPSQPPNSSPPLLVAASCDHTRAVLLTYDCEIDKPSAKVLTVALVRPLDPKTPEADKAVLRENRKFAFFHLPPEQANGPESYLDFRRIGAVSVEVVKAAIKRASLSDLARKAMLFQFFRFLTRIDLSRAQLPPPEEEQAAG